MDKIDEMVKEAYRNATENEYMLSLLSDQELTNDMRDYDAKIAEFSNDEVLQAVQRLRKVVRHG